MNKRLYLINPASDFPTYYGGEVFAASGLESACTVADLATATVAAMAARHLQVQICDASISPIDFETPAEYVGITGKVTQAGQMLRIAREFRARGKTVIIGGPFASLSPEVVRADCDILVRGELEDIADQFFTDLRSGNWAPEYDGGQPPITASPIPRWDLYPNHRALVGAVQTSRGCPFECEFCDVIEYLGRKQRFKSIPQILAELDELHQHGYRKIFICDDNFTVARKRAKEVVIALRDWNNRHPDSLRCRFETQASIEAAEDDTLLALCADAGLNMVFVGIETPNEASLRETKKHQNLRTSMQASINKLVESGIAVRGGMIVGFDADGPDIFPKMYNFAMSLPIPHFSLGALVAPAGTPLFDRIRREGRLVSGGSEVAAMPWDTNIVPKQMTRQELLQGLRWLGNRLYRPAAFLERLRNFAQRFGVRRSASQFDNNPQLGDSSQPQRPVNLDAMQLIKNLRTLGAEEAAMCKEVFRTLTKQPATNSAIMEMLWSYVQVRYLYREGRFWDTHVPDHYDAPPLVPLSVAGKVF